MNSCVAPLSSVKKQQYEEKMNSERKKQEDAFAKRIVENAEYTKITTEKLLKEFSAFKAAEAAKMANPDAFYVPAEPKFMVACLIRSQRKIGPTPRKVLELLRLKTINSAVIIRNNKSIKNMLSKVKDYVAFGYVDYEMLRKLLYKRGFGKINNSKVALTSENIELAFDGKYRCVEELVAAIYNGSDDIKKILNFLWPLKLSCPIGGFIGKKSMNYLQGGSTNNHKELLGNLLEKMI